MFKKCAITVGFLLGAVGPLQAANLASGQALPSTDGGNTHTYDVTADSFVVTSFTFNLSDEVSIAATEDSNQISVASGSLKGNQVFGGNSEGGSVSQCGTYTEVTSGAYTVPIPAATDCVGGTTSP